MKTTKFSDVPLTPDERKRLAAWARELRAVPTRALTRSEKAGKIRHYVAQDAVRIVASRFSGEWKTAFGEDGKAVLSVCPVCLYRRAKRVGRHRFLPTEVEGTPVAAWRAGADEGAECFGACGQVYDGLPCDPP